MKTKIRLLSIALVLVIAIVCVFAACGTNNDTTAVPESITVSKAPDKTKYTVGEVLDVTGGMITLHYENNKTKEVPMTSDMVPGDKLTVGEQMVSVTYTVGDTKLSATFGVVVLDKVVVRLEITKNPVKLNYVEGQTFDSTGIAATAYYRDGSSEDVSASLSFDKTVLSNDDTFVVVSYGERSVVLNVAVSEKTVSSITVKRNPFKLRYNEGEMFDPTGLIVVVNYNDGTSFEASALIDFTFDRTELTGENQVVVGTYRNFEKVTFKIQIEITQVDLA